MSGHRATVTWTLAVSSEEFLKRRYSRVHRIAFEGGAEVVGTPSPAVVPAPWSQADAMDPEGAFTAALSACHMLWFLDHAARAGFVVASYVDAAEGTLGRIAPGKMAMTRVALRPVVVFSGDNLPSAEELERLHHDAHRDCFIANSVTTEVVVESPLP
jgi:organic hydroperoxide reductase OsmC/OhrA